MAHSEFRAVLRNVQTLFSAGTASGLSDVQLIERFVGREDDAAELAFTALVERHGPMVLRVCLGVLGDPHASEDAFQATFLILARKAGTIRNQDSLASWLFGVARRVALRARVEQARRMALEQRKAGMATDHLVETRASTLLPEVQEEVDRLPEKYRAPVVLCYFEGLTHEEAAGQLRLPVGTVKIRLSRARGRLRGRLLRRGLAPALLASGLSRKGLAAPSASIVESTIQAAVSFAAGRGLRVSEPVAALVEGVLHAMYLSRLKSAAALAATALTLLVASAGVLTLIAKPARSDPPKPEAATSPTAAARKVAVRTVAKSALQVRTVTVASVHPFQTVNIVPRIPGYLKNLSVDIGDTVKRGQSLAEIEAPELEPERARTQGRLLQAQARFSGAKVAVTLGEAAIEVETAKQAIATAGLERATAQLGYRKKELLRYRDLLGRNAVTPQIVDEYESHFETAEHAVAEAKGQADHARAGLVEARARLESARAGVLEAEAEVHTASAEHRKTSVDQESCVLRSPFDGIVTKREYFPGDYVRAGAEGASRPVLTIVSVGKMRVVVNVPDRSVSWLDIGDPVTIRVDAIPGRTFEGKISRTAYAEDPGNRTLRAEIDLDNTDGALRPGQYGSATIVLGDLGTCLNIPLSALLKMPDHQNRTECYRVQNGKAVRTLIKVGQDDGERIEVLEGLAEGDVVVENGSDGVKDGQVVEAVQDAGRSQN